MSAVFDLLIFFGFSVFLIWFFIKFFLRAVIWTLKKTRYFLFLAVIGYVAYNFTSYFLWTVGIIFIVFLFLVFISILIDAKDKKEFNKNIEKCLKENNVIGLSNYFSSLESGKKKEFISTYKKHYNNNKVLDYLCAMDFCAFAVSHGSGNSAIIEAEHCKKYLSEIWEYESWNEFYKNIKREINSTSSDWTVSEESPKNQSTGKKINLIKITRKNYDIFENAISLD